MNQPYDPNQPQWGQPAGGPPTGGQPPQQWGPQTGSQQPWGAQPDQSYGQQQSQYGQQSGYGQQPNYGQQPAYGAPGQPQYGAPGGGQPWGAPPPKSGNGKMIGFLIGGLVLVAAIGVTLWLVLRDGDGSGGSGPGGTRTVAETIDGYIEAAKDNDKEAAKNYLCPKLDQMVDESGESSPVGTDFDATVTNIQENGDTATADLDVTAMGSTATVTVHLTKASNGDWEICDFGFDYGGSEYGGGSGGYSGPTAGG